MIDYNYILKKYNLQLDHKYDIEIPGMDSINLAELFNELGYKRGVELGVDWGEYSGVLCTANPDLKLDSIDPYISSAYEDGNGVNEKQKYFDDLYKRAKKQLEPYKNCNLVRKTSAEALKDYEDESLDFVYIDANHDFPNFIFDIHNWSKKVKVGGIVSGHDFAYFSYRKFNHVKRALLAYARCYRMIPLFVCGNTTENTRLKRDKYRSWFWIKQ